MAQLKPATFDWSDAKMFWDGGDFSVQVPLYADGLVATALQHTLPDNLRQRGTRLRCSIDLRHDGSAFNVVISGLKGGTAEEVNDLEYDVRVSLTEAYEQASAASDTIASMLSLIHDLPVAEEAKD